MYSYKVKLYNEDPIFTGIVPGETYYEALKNICDYYGEIDIESVNIAFVSDRKVLLVPNDIIDTLVKENNV